MNRPSTPDHSVPHDIAPPPWPETGLPPYGDAAYGDAVYPGAAYPGAVYPGAAYPGPAFGDTAYGDPYGTGAIPGAAAGAGAAAPPGFPYGEFTPAPAPPGPGFGTAPTAGDPAQRHVPATAPDRTDEPDLRLVVPQPHARPEAGAGARPAAPERGDRAAGPAPDARPPALAGRLSRGGVLAAADCLAGLFGLCTVGFAGNPVLPAVLLCVLLAAHRRAGLYRPALTPAALDEVPAIALGTVLAWGLAAAATAATAPHGALGWSQLLDATALTGCAAVFLRALAHRLHRHRARRTPARTLVIGAAPAAQDLAAALRAHPEYGLAPVVITAPAPPSGPGGHDLAAPVFPGFAHPPGPHLRESLARRTAKAEALAVPGAPAPYPPGPPGQFAPGVPAALPHLVTTAAADIARIAVREAVRHAVVVGPAGPATERAVALLAAHGCRIWQVDPAGHRPEATGADAPGRIAPPHLWGYACRPMAGGRGAGRRGKRALDIVLSGLALTAAAPALAGCALAVRLADGPGVLFRQERIGLGGRPFTLLKFRTLRPADDQEAATRWNVAHDHRMSAVGRLLRRTSLDELPQFWNVLRGDMSLVGPRPERPFFVEKFSGELPGYQDRHRMPAGITGLAQVNGLRGDTSIPDRARFDNHYIDSWSLWQDIAILVRTATSFFRFGGS
ncbi:Sugar transferase involved in LPS biosynthesis (colanic, teichoic acid) [Actinacidiphila yanglinensis]|uniref:Sugar transferase involved in LPS biosynthesis (Colanic, teichoic acid) n=1 Tax=Actinacidiphila yanglinensis TaxID=310779 RepID=A0A1H6AHK5_9ACTN|nr:sugar transferase [Actinacidiphila yanglinensis]SEG47236.1 Sugar transferase involved in LPS biosynthesis (colanic, teichoic acid) [Actinacidiphila yanglinensis]